MRSRSGMLQAGGGSPGGDAQLGGGSACSCRLSWECVWGQAAGTSLGHRLPVAMGPAWVPSTHPPSAPGQAPHCTATANPCAR